MRKVYHFKVLRSALLLLLGAPAFVAMSVFLLWLRPDDLVIRIIGIAGILFFGAGLVVGLISLPRLLRNSEALILTPQQLVIRQVFRRRATTLKWSEIEGLSPFYIQSEHFIVLHLNDSRRRIMRERNGLQRFLMKWNDRITGSPFNIATSTIRCKRDELVETLIQYLEKYGRTATEAEPGTNQN